VRALGASAPMSHCFSGRSRVLRLMGIARHIVGKAAASGAWLAGATVDNLYVSSRPAPIELTPHNPVWTSDRRGMSLASAASRREKLL